MVNIIYSYSDVDGAFYAYDRYLIILLDVIINYEYSKMPPRLFQITAKSLSRVLSYVGDDINILRYGVSWDATRTWHRNKQRIPIEMRIQLYDYSKQNSLSNLYRFMKELVTDSEV